MLGLFKKVFPGSNEREIKKMMKVVAEINALEPEYEALTDEQLHGKTAEFRTRLENDEELDDLLPEAFAAVREASKRTLGMRHFDVQLVGGMVLHKGKIAEMRTGEGKTLVATLSIYLNALLGKGAHVVTVNEYLAKRDRDQMGKIYEFLGMTVGVNLNALSHEEKQEAYACDITYSTNNELGFDYLRDNMVLYQEQMVQRPLYYAVIDEVDSILIDEARTPLIISGQAEKSTDLYYAAARFASQTREHEDYTVDLKLRSVMLTEAGVEKAERTFGLENLYDHENITINHHISQAMKAKAIMKRDVDYVVENGEVVIVDEFTGRLMTGRRYSDGLHQAIEAKENLKVQNESMTLATITFQNYFRMYKKLSGMTGTAKTEEEEFRKIYGLDVIVVPTNRPMIRVDMPDVVYKSEEGKFNAAVEEIVERHRKGQPVLVGTVSIENSEKLSAMLKKRGVGHKVLNAKKHAEEAEIVSMAGQKGAVTIATNMAGRGTDIVLGPEVSELGGLHIIGTERHESRRIDNQLRGRSGRQGDPGSTQFYISLQDELMRRFGAENIMAMMDRFGFQEDQPIESKLVTRAIESAQKRVEGNNFDVRKVVLQYDDVMNQQREVIYKQRREILSSDNIRAEAMAMLKAYVDKNIAVHCADDDVPDEWDLASIAEVVNTTIFSTPVIEVEELEEKEKDEMSEYIMEVAARHYDEKEQQLGEEVIREFEKVIVLRAVDSKWMDHIDAMDQLRTGIHLRAYGGTDPLREYQFEGYEMFQGMVERIQEEVAQYIMKAQIQQNLERKEVAKGQAAMAAEDGKPKINRPVRRAVDKIGRNDACPCGSGKKYKLCCGR